MQEKDTKYLWYQTQRSYVLDSDIHFLNVKQLKVFLNPVGKIIHRKFTGLSRKNQDRITREIKIARQLGLLPFSC